MSRTPEFHTKNLTPKVHHSSHITQTTPTAERIPFSSPRDNNPDPLTFFNLNRRTARVPRPLTCLETRLTHRRHRNTPSENTSQPTHALKISWIDRITSTASSRMDTLRWYHRKGLSLPNHISKPSSQSHASSPHENTAKTSQTANLTITRPLSHIGSSESPLHADSEYKTLISIAHSASPRETRENQPHSKVKYPSLVPAHSIIGKPSFF